MKDRVINELKSIFWTTLYFFCWFGGLMLIKILLLREYQIQFVGLTLVIVGALVVAKVVLILEYVPMPFTKHQPAWVEILARSLLYLSGIFVVMVLEKSFEARVEYHGMIAAIKNLPENADIYHVWVNVISAFGALLFFNIWTVVKKYYGEGKFLKMMKTPVPDSVIHG
jgi:hypothetical protein